MPAPRVYDKYHGEPAPRLGRPYSLEAVRSLLRARWLRGPPSPATCTVIDGVCERLH